MRSCYTLQLGKHLYKIAIADLCDYYGQGWLLTRINVPAEFRGNGHGSALLREILTEADKTQTRLFLEISSSGPLDYEDLEKWYFRHGFKKWKGIYLRKPEGN